MQKQILMTVYTLFLVSSVTANEPISANLTLTTDYVWRGISQTAETPAIQGGLDWANDNGFYIGTWGSNVDFASVENLELDVYAGWSTELSSGLGLDLGFIQYLYYDSDNDVDFNEIYAGLNYADFSGKVSYDTDNKNTYMEIAYATDLANNFGVGVHIGHYDFDASADYTDYSLSISKAYAGLDFGLAYYATDIDNINIADDRVVFSIGKSF